MIVVVPTCQFGHRAVTRLRPGGGGRREFRSSASRNRGDQIRPRNREAAADIPTCDLGDGIYSRAATAPTSYLKVV